MTAPSWLGNFPFRTSRLSGHGTSAPTSSRPCPDTPSHHLDLARMQLWDRLNACHLGRQDPLLPSRPS